MRILKLSLIVTAMLSLYPTASQAETEVFPVLNGSNLEGKKYEIPKSLEGKYNIVFIAFKREHQILINSWIPLTKSIIKKYPESKYYEIPFLNEGYQLFRGIIDGGMRSGIKDKKDREATITVYDSKTKFMESLDIKDDKNIHVFVLNKQGNILWRAIGAVNENDKKELNNLFEKLYKK